MFNSEIKSSISIYSIDCNINPIFIGDHVEISDNLNSNNNSDNLNNI